MEKYIFPKELYVGLDDGGDGESLRLGIYRRLEPDNKGVVHMKKVGLVWLDKKELSLENIVKSLKNKDSWTVPD